NVFGAVVFGTSPEAKKMIDAENAERRKGAKNNNQITAVKEVYVGNTAKNLTHPDTGRLLTAKAPDGPEIPFETGKDMREALLRWLATPEKPFFSRSCVNRIWGHYLGIGIVHPVDDFSLANPASNDKLLDALAKEFSDKKFDIRNIERLILNSRVYQLSSKTN